MICTIHTLGNRFLLSLTTTFLQMIPTFLSLPLKFTPTCTITPSSFILINMSLTLAISLSLATNKFVIQTTTTCRKLGTLVINSPNLTVILTTHTFKNRFLV